MGWWLMTPKRAIVPVVDEVLSKYTLAHVGSNDLLLQMVDMDVVEDVVVAQTIGSG